MPGGGGEAGHGVGIWLSLLARGQGKGIWLILFFRGRVYLDLSSPDVEIFDCRLRGSKRLRLNICFPLPRFTHTPYGLEISGNRGGHRWQANLLRHCGIKVNRNKEKPSRFLQVQLISAWLIRYNHCIKLVKLTFFVPLIRMVYLNLQNVDFLLKGFCILRSVTRIMVKTYNCSCNRNMYLWWCSNVYK